MNKRTIGISALFLSMSILLLVPGCVHESKTLKEQSRNKVSQISPMEKFISLTYKIFSNADCKKYLGRSNVIRKGYQPIQITITNNTDRCLNFSLHNISLPCVPFEEVASEVHISANKRAIGFGIGGLFCWPLLIPAVIYGVKGESMNDRIDADFERKALDDQVISPYTTVGGIVFVPVNMFSRKSPFSVVLFDQANDTKFELNTACPTIKL